MNQIIDGRSNNAAPQQGELPEQPTRQDQLNALQEDRNVVDALWRHEDIRRQKAQRYQRKVIALDNEIESLKGSSMSINDPEAQQSIADTSKLFHSDV
jgi:hypothetical protein